MNEHIAFVAFPGNQDGLVEGPLTFVEIWAQLSEALARNLMEGDPPHG